MDKKPKVLNEFSPKLKMAAAEIKDVLAKYDIGAIVVLHEPAHTEFFMKVDPSYSAAYLENQQLKLRPVITGADGAIPEKVVQTVNLLNNLQMLSGRITMALAQAIMYARSFYNLPKPPAGAQPRNGQMPTGGKG